MRKGRQIASIILLTLFLLHPIGSMAGHRTVVDTEGREVRIPGKVERAVVLSATCIEAIYILGSIDKVAGISRDMRDGTTYAELIRGLKRIPVVSQTIRDVNIEKLFAVKPDLVITMGPEHPLGMGRSEVERIERLGIPVLLLNLESLDENYHSIELMGKVFNNEKKAGELVDNMKRIVREVQQKVQIITEGNRVRAIYVSGDKPTYILAGYWGEQDIIFLAGGFNVASEIKRFTTVVSLEQINIWDPDVFIISPRARYDPEDILKNPQLKNVNAVKNKRVYKVSKGIGGLFTPRVALQMAWLAEKFYPELGIGWTKIADDFFRKFYGTPYYGPKD